MSSASTFSLSDLERMYAEIARHGNESSPAAQALLQQIYARRQRGKRAPSDGVLTEYYLPIRTYLISLGRLWINLLAGK